MRNISRSTTEELCSGEDNVKDGNGYKAVSTEQCTSASHVAAARFFDISSLPSVAGDTQVHMSGAPRLLRPPVKDCAQVWIRLPPIRRPNSWDSIEELVALLERILYGHPVAAPWGEGRLVEVCLQQTWEKRYRHGDVCTSIDKSQLFWGHEPRCLGGVAPICHM